jgi:hypothetical protein
VACCAVYGGLCDLIVLDFQTNIDGVLKSVVTFLLILKSNK